MTAAEQLGELVLLSIILVRVQAHSVTSHYTKVFNMSHFAQINENNIVQQVLVIDQDMIDTGLWGDPKQWIQTSYNTRGGIHYGPNGEPDGGIAVRKNYAGIGFTWDASRDAFIPPKPYTSWILNERTCLWDPPVPYPTDGKNYIWEESLQEWKEPL